MSEQEIKDFLEMADTKGDGKIYYKEFVKILKK